MVDCCIENRKMNVLREVAKDMPDGHLDFILKTLDTKWDEQMKQLNKKYLDRIIELESLTKM